MGVRLVRDAIRKAKFMAAAARAFEGVEATLSAVEEMRDCLPSSLEHAAPLIDGVVQNFRTMKASLGLVLAGGDDEPN